jgi:integrase
MPRRKLAPRLYLDRRRDQWVIRDGSTFVRTGCSGSDGRGAEEKLLAYLGQKHTPERSDAPLILDMLTVYGREHVPHTRSAANTAHNLNSLKNWWDGKRLVDITPLNCREYARGRTPAAARRDLEVLRAAVNYWHKWYGPLPSVPAVILPPKSLPRERWLTRTEVRALLRAAKGTPHIYRFIILGVTTGSRSGAILGLRWDRIDLQRGIMYRRAFGQAEDERKRAPPVRLGRAALKLLRRWHHAESEAKRPVIPTESGHLFRSKAATDSDRRRPPC